MKQMNTFTRIGIFVPQGMRDKIKKELLYADIKMPVEKFTGMAITLGLMLSLVLGILFDVFLGYNIGIIFTIFLAVSLGVTYYRISSSATGKALFVEKMLPDALQLVSSNIKAGLTTERALFISARPEFGPLSIELKEASKKIIAGETLSNALLGLPKKIKSITVERTMWLITQGIKSGGQIADLLTNLSTDLREENAVREEIKASTSMYVLMIFVAAAFGAPALFSLSGVIVGTIADQTGSIDVPDIPASARGRGGIPLDTFVGGSSSINADFVTMFTQIALVITIVFSALTIGVITTGRESDGFRYIPIMLIIGFVLFFTVRAAMGGLLGGLAGVA